MTTDTKPLLQRHYDAGNALDAMTRLPLQEFAAESLKHARFCMDELRHCAMLALNATDEERPAIERRLWRLIAPPAATNVVSLPSAAPAPVDDGLQVYRLPSGWRVGRRHTNGVTHEAGPFKLKTEAEAAMAGLRAQQGLPC